MSLDPNYVALFSTVAADVSLRIPFKYLVITPNGVRSLFDIVKEYISSGLSLVKLSQDFPNFLPIDIAMVYYNMYKGNLGNIVELYTYKELSTSLANIENDFENWKRSYTSLAESDTRYAKKISKSIETISSIDDSSLLVSPLRYTYTTRKVNPQIRFHTEEGTSLRDPTKEDGLELFDSAIPSYDVPFIQYNEISGEIDDVNDNKKYKIYSGNSENPVPLDLTILPKADTTNKHTIYLTVWIGRNLSKLSKEYYIQASYDLESNSLEFSVPLKETETADLIITRLETCLHLVIDRNLIKDMTVGAEFFIYEQYITSELFTYSILNDDVMATFIYSDERGKPSSLKKVQRLKYKTLNQLLDIKDPLLHAAWITYHTIDVQNTEINSLRNGTSLQLNPGQQYVKISITKALTADVAKGLYDIFPKLFKYYLMIKPKLVSELMEFFNIIQEARTIDEIKIRESQDGTKRKRSDRDIFKLKELGQGLIEGNFARACQCERKPKIVDQSEVPEWSVKQFIYKGVTHNHNVLPFPPDNPKWWFICVNDSYPFPGVKINPYSSSNQYPYVPCCFKKNQMIPGSGTKYDYYYNGNPLRTTSNKVKVILNTGKSLTSKRLGELPVSILNLLKKYDNDLVYYRLGSIISPNSLLHCLLEALDSEEYTKIEGDEAKESYIRRYRKHFFSDVKYPVDMVKQELYDYTDGEIRELLSNPEVFLDPALYYRFLEEFFKVNIYVFSTPKDNESTFGMLEAPRHKLFHTRRLRDGVPTILIFKHWGSDSNKLFHQQCELIVSYDESSEKVINRHFDNDMSILLHDVMTTTKVTISWSIDPNNMRIVPRKNLFNSINSYEILGGLKGEIIGQILDGYGKARAFIIKSDPLPITVIVPPCQPENLPLHLDIANRPNIKTIYKLFGNDPSFISINSKGLVDGLWYKVMDLDEGFYLPIEETRREELSDVPVGPGNPLFIGGKNMVRRLKEMRKINKIVLQVVQWLFLKSKLPLSQFVEMYFKVDPRKIVNSEKYYNIREIPRQLPDITSFDKCLSYIQQAIPGLVHESQIVMYSKKYAEGVIYYLKEFVANHDMSKVEPSRELQSILDDASDYKQFNNTVIFIKESDMRTWLFSRTKLGIKSSKIYRKIDFNDIQIQEPFLYGDPSGRFYIIQNVITSSFKRAIQIAYGWYTKKINYGFEATEYADPVVPRHVVYGITSANIPEPILDNREGEDQFLQILNYGDNQYAAMLPL